MDEDIEDLLGDVKYTDSQKSVATTNMYSMDFDSSSDKNNSSGKETYVIECDDSEDSETYLLHSNRSVVNLFEREHHTAQNVDVLVKTKKPYKRHKTASTSVHKCLFVAQEIFTQTSKTIIELAEIETLSKVERKSLETQTSLISIKESKIVEQSLELTNSVSHCNVIKHDFDVNNSKRCVVTCDQLLNGSLEDGSSKFLTSEPENSAASDDSDRIINIIDDESKDNELSEEQIANRYENTSDFEDTNSDIEQDSLMECCQLKPISDNQSDSSEVTKSVDHDIEDLYTKLSESIDLYPFDKTSEEGKRKIGTLTPLTEESTMKKDSVDTSSYKNNFNSLEKDVPFTNNQGMRIKLLPNEDIDKSSFKLPPIQNNKSCPNSPHLNFLFSLNASSKNSERAGALPTVVEDQNQKRCMGDRWEIGNKELASGEGALINGNYDSMHFSPEYLQLPPIHIEGHVVHNARTSSFLNDRVDAHAVDTYSDSISIKNKIRELKMSRHAKKNIPTPRSRSMSPISICHEGSRISDVAEKGCEALCAELSRRLRSTSWTQIADTLEDVPRSLDKFWGIISEQRIADLIRLVSAHVESPRTQVSRSACHTLASILKNTNYTKKPDFHEAVTILLTKTGSYSRPVRRAANVALDDIVSGVEFSHAITALCIHGASHKSPLVRCASARLLVVSCALAGGGRELLRARPPTAAAARRYALRSLAALLEDKNTDTRKYAERLYTMLRPLGNFEAYYLTDVDVEQASRQMKKYDQLLLNEPPKER
ncbi:hypothetical protein O3G_MSEX013189 [Manduca sexta]|nr:hypothetical protein O3G_MSEX013189 [Manduca sexta]